MSSPSTESPVLRRQFKMRDAFTLAFVYISPIVGLYAVFGLVLQAAGPAGWWAFPIVLVLQLLIAVALGVLVSRWPFQGGSFQWARRLVGEHYGWATGWAYIWTITIVTASNAYAIVTFLQPLLGVAFTLEQHILLTIGVVVGATALNIVGPVVLKVLSRMSLVAEVLGSVVLATILLIWHRQQPISILFDTAGASSHHYLWGGLILAIGFVGFGFAGFESVCSMAEEIEDPARNLPKAIIGALLAIGAVVMYSSLALILATPDFAGAIAGTIADPAAETITASFGPGIAKPFFALVVIGFAASMLAAQTTVSRVVWSFSRDRLLPGATWMAKLSRRHKTPDRALVVVGALAIAVTLLAFSERVYSTLIAASSAGFFVTMALVVVGLLVRILQRRWTMGPFTAGVLTPVIVIGAAGWAVFEVVNLAWPRSAGDQPWFVTWSLVIGLVGIAVLGFVTWLTVRRNIDALTIGEHAVDVAATHAVPMPPTAASETNDR